MTMLLLLSCSDVDVPSQVGLSTTTKPEKKKFYSDHLAVVNAYNQWHAVLHERGPSEAFLFARSHYLSHAVFNDVKLLRENFRRHLFSVGLLQEQGLGLTKSKIDEVEEEVEDIVEVEDEVEDEDVKIIKSPADDSATNDMCKLDHQERVHYLLSSLCAGE